MQGVSKQGGGQPSSFSPGQCQVTPQDQEKAAWIMQVLQWVADQIAMLPSEQRPSTLILKEQIQKSTGTSGKVLESIWPQPHKVTFVI